MTRPESPMASLVGRVARPRPAVPVDELDLALLRKLTADSRQSQRGLAREVEVSPPAVGDRLSRLERTGVIQRYTLDVDWDALGYPVVVYIPMKMTGGGEMGR